MALGILVGAFFKFLLAGEAERTLSLFGAELGLRAFFVDGIFHAGGQIFVASLKCWLSLWSLFHWSAAPAH